MRYLVKRIPSTSLVHYDGSRYYCEIAGGTAEKATVDTADLLSGSKYLDVQTGNWYVYDELSNSWALSQEGGSADPAVIEQAVTDWLDAHPEATTTVADGSITEAKLASALAQKVNQVTQLSDEIVDVKAVTVSTAFSPISITLDTGKLIDSVGSVSSVSGQDITTPIPVTAGKAYKIIAGSNWTNSAYAWYSSDIITSANCVDSKHPSSSTGSAGYTVDEIVVAPQNATYVVLSRVGNKSIGISEESGYKNIADNAIALAQQMYPNDLHLYKSGNDVTITDTNTSLKVGIVLNGSNNGALTFTKYFNANGTIYKNAEDDICPITYDSSYRCGNHGLIAAYEVIASSHGLTESSIGEVFTSANNISYVLIKVPDENKLWILPDVQSYPFPTTAPTSPLTNSGTTYAFTSATLLQLVPGINHIEQKIFANGIVVSSAYDADCTNVEIVETYNSIDAIKMLSVLKSNVGSNTNESYYSDSLEADLIYRTSYKITKGLCMVVSANIITLRQMNLGTIGIVQSQSIGTRHYIPYTNETEIGTGNDISYSNSVWADQDFPPNKFYQFNATNDSIGFVVAYNPEWGEVSADVRKDIISAGHLSSQDKMYPYAYYKGAQNNVPAFTVINGYAIRMPVVIDSNAIHFSYKIENDIYIEIDTLSTETHNIKVNGIEGRRISVLHKTDAIELLSSIAINNFVIVKGKGSITLKAN